LPVIFALSPLQHLAYAQRAVNVRQAEFAYSRAIAEKRLDICAGFVDYP
jgi:hypothetical protein